MPSCVPIRIRPETSAPGAEPLLPIGFGALYEVVQLAFGMMSFQEAVGIYI